MKPPPKAIDHRVEISYSIDDPQFRRALGQMLGPPVVSLNHVEAFQNGAEIFPAMLKAIRSAKETITFEAFIYWSDHVGQEFVQALTERARAGVKVHVLVDWFGSRRMTAESMQKLRDAGVELQIFRPLKWYNLSRMNNRTHRRILVIDGRTGFTGGVGICDDWSGNADEPHHWRDSQYKVEGPVVASLQSAFMDNWLKVAPNVHHGELYFPPLQAAGQADAQVFRSSPQAGSENVRLMYLLAIAAAKKEILLSSAYFVPDEISVQEFVQARRRGVQVKLIVPGPYSDSAVVKSASKAQWGPLLEAGVEIYEYQPSRFHCKMMIVDGVFVSVGSTNFDDRSFRLNSEENLNIFDAQFARSQQKIFAMDLEKSKLVTLDSWRARPWSEKILEAMTDLIQAQL